MTKTILDIRFEAAILEIVEAAQLPLNKEIIETWLSDYEDLWFAMKNELGNLPVPLDIIHSRSMEEFHCIYTRFKDIKAYYRAEVVCEQAMKEYRQIMAKNAPLDGNVPLRTWVAKYEKLGLEDLVIPPVEPGCVNYTRTIYGVTYFISGSEFKNAMDFYTIFSGLNNVYA